MVIVASKDIFTSLSTQNNSIDKSIRGYVNVIRYGYDSGNMYSIVWIPVKVNLSDPGTKTDTIWD